MQQRSWTFHRGDEQLVLQRHETDGGFALVVVVNGTASTIPFQKESALTVFQNDMEELLVHTGWQLQECQPERRQKRDRRRFPRVTNDRRRWWTDPAPTDNVYVPTRGDRRTSKSRAEKD
ncbi:MAG TPA: hypothetical protein VMJ74_16970 [Pseudomonadales bacterium]|nr:hypothetical protein [Pseudomonadales bacterium]